MAARDRARSTCAATPSVLPRAPQPLICEMCGDNAQPDDFIQGLAAVICPLCLERLMDTPTEDLL